MQAQSMRTCRPTRAAFSVRRARPASRTVRVAVAAQAPPQTEKQTYYALVANAEFFVNDVQNESLAEQLRERVRFLKEKGQQADFYLIPNPVWLDAKFPKEAKMVKRPCMALVSTDKMWATFMKLRLDRVLKLDLSQLSEEEVLQMGEALPEFKLPEKWTAPYAAYAAGWWEVFYPKKQ